MRTFIITAGMILSTALAAPAETYRWTDENDVTHFTDSLETVPAKYRQKVVTERDITIRDPKIREEVRQQEERAQQQEQRAREEAASAPSRGATYYDEPVRRPEEIRPAPPASDELPPGRTKSQKIQDNINRRTLGGQ